jgi:aspartate kinase
MLSVLKVGGSVLRDDASYAATAGFLRGRLAERPDERLVVIVSAQYGATDELLAEARAIVAGPGASEGRPPSRGALRRDSLRLEGSRAAACPAVARSKWSAKAGGGESEGAPPSGVHKRLRPQASGGAESPKATARAQRGGESEGAPPSEVNNDALDLLWSTGELRSVARLALHLQRIGVSAIPFNVHQAGLVADRVTGTTVRPLRLLAALAASRIVIVPGFLGVSAGGTITSLGRGGSDLTAVLLAIAIRADACELVKDVPGYFTADPHRDSKARQIHDLPIDEALRMADTGCDLVQRAALGAAAQAGLDLVIRSMDAAAPVTRCHSRAVSRSKQYGVRHQDDSRRAAV